MAFDKNAPNLAVWERVSKTDPQYTKPITGRAFKGTALNPTYAVKKMTEEFGPVGWGWGYRILAFEDVLSVGDKLTNHAHIEVWYYPFGRADEKEMRRAVFEQVGATEFAGKRKSSGEAFADDEARKKSVTDALLKAMSHIGIGGDIHLGLFDDTKYVEERANAESQAQADMDRRNKVDDRARVLALGEALVQELANVEAESDYMRLRGEATALRPQMQKLQLNDQVQTLRLAIEDAARRLNLAGAPPPAANGRAPNNTMAG